MASDVADLRALLLGLDLPLRFEAPDTVVGGGSEIGALGFFVSTHAPGFVAVVNALPSMLDRTERMEAELRDLGQRAEAAQCALVDEQIAASEARRLALANDRLRQVAEGERDLLRVQVANATARAERAEAMLNAVRRETECQEDETPQGSVRRKLRMLARAEARVRDLEAIIAGRTTPPTPAERVAHLRATGHDGRWRVCVDGRDIVGSFDNTVLGDALTAKSARWWPLDADGCPCAWPTAEVSHG